MKRVTVSLILLALIFALGGYSMFTSRQVYRKVNEQLDTIKASSQRDDALQTAQLAEELTESWAENKKKLAKFVRHQSLDEISQLADQLPAFARHRATAELHACLDRIAGCIEEIWINELPTFTNIL